MNKVIVVLIWGLAVFNLSAKPLIIFEPDKNLNSFTQLNKYKTLVKRIADRTLKPQGMKQSMRVETLKQDEADGQYWYIFNGCSWDGRRGDTRSLKMQPIEIEFYISPAEAVSLPDSNAGTKYLDKTTAVRFCFGSGSRENSIKLILRRSFFLSVDKEKNELRAREDRTGKWIVVSIQRDAAGNPAALNVRSSASGKYESAAKSEYLFEVPKMPDWQHACFIAIECWGKAPDNFSFNIGRIALGKINEQLD